MTKQKRAEIGLGSSPEIKSPYPAEPLAVPEVKIAEEPAASNTKMSDEETMKLIEEVFSYLNGSRDVGNEHGCHYAYPDVVCDNICDAACGCSSMEQTQCQMSQK